MGFLRKHRRFAALAALLAIVLVAVFADPRLPERSIDSVAAEPARPAASAPSGAELPAQIRREAPGAAAGGGSFGQPEPRNTAVIAQAGRQAAPAPPSMPPFPYRYLGKISEPGGRLTVFLTLGEETYPASAGRMLGDAYRIDRIEADQFELTYLPLNAPLRLRYAEISQPVANVPVQLPVTPATGTAVAPAEVDPDSSEPLPERQVAPPIADRDRH